jgi:membrane protein required for colicin V production
MIQRQGTPFMLLTSLSRMNPLDWFLTALLAYSVIRAVMRGFVREAFALGGLVVGLVLACWNFRELGQHLRGLVNEQPLADLLGFFAILIVVTLVATLLGKILSRTASAVGLGFFDRAGGAVFGLARGALLGLAVLLAVTVFLPSSPWVKTSSLAPYFLRADHAVSFVMPTDLRARLASGLKRTPGHWSL